MNEFLKNNKLFISILIFIILSGLLYVFTVIPAWKKIVDNSNLIKKSYIDSQVIEKKIGNIEHFKNQYQLVLENEKKLYNFTSKEFIVDLIKEIESLSESTGTVINIEIDEEEKLISNNKKTKQNKKNESLADNLPVKDYVTMVLKVEGSYENIFNLVRKIENNPYYSDIISLTIVNKVSESQYTFNSRSELSPFESGDQANEENQENSEKKLVADLITVFYLDNDKK